MKYLTALLLMVLAIPLKAETLHLDYSAFYSHVRKLDNEDTQALQFAFGFKHVNESNLCDIRSAYIHTQKKDLPLTINQAKRFMLPSERALKLAKAKVIVDLEQNANLCDISVQLETKADYLKTAYSADELVGLHEQYQAFFDNMGSFLSFLMPTTHGLVLHFDEPVLVDAPGTIASGNTLILTDDWLEEGHGLSLPKKPLKVTANVR